MATSQTLTTKDGRFNYEAKGDASMTPLVFLHGIGGAGRGWRPQIDTFGDRYFAIGWDAPGYGGSRQVETPSIAAFAAALKEFLAGIGADRPVLVGHSIGGMIVQQLLTTDPHRRSAVRTANGRRTSSMPGSGRSTAARRWNRWLRSWWPGWSATILIAPALRSRATAWRR
jgi:pimeloyl-ACP methyl ester carboxylesterase